MECKTEGHFEVLCVTSSEFQYIQHADVQTQSDSILGLGFSSCVASSSYIKQLKAYVTMWIKDQDPFSVQQVFKKWRAFIAVLKNFPFVIPWCMD